MNNANKHLAVLIFTLLSIGVSMGIVAFQSFQSSKLTLHDELPQTLENAVRQVIKTSSKHTPFYFYAKHGNDPERIGTYEKKTITRKDTTIVYMHKNVDFETEIYHTFQRCLLSTDSMYCPNIQSAFESLLSEKNIHAKSIIGITSTGLYNDLDRVSEDTTGLKINDRIAYTVDTSSKEITYTAYMGYSLYTYWKLVPTAKIHMLLLLVVLLVGSIAWFIISSKKKKTIVSEIIEEQMPSALLDESRPADLLLFEKGYIVFNGNREKIQPQSMSILQLFLDSPNLQVPKSVIKEIWTGNYDKTRHMASAINRINQLFSRIGYPYRISSEKENRPFYALLPQCFAEETSQEEHK